ncbi:hypothetical protein [Desulfosarcina cetonica]|uniref:hypothetical protein n=1 Tax=Desulfosarcina cetonica TaxID=90730 RepID=UPI00155D8E9A|nr:hypothetical protein [Desulfosarcina cetonica]
MSDALKQQAAKKRGDDQKNDIGSEPHIISTLCFYGLFREQQQETGFRILPNNPHHRKMIPTITVIFSRYKMVPEGPCPACWKTKKT